MSYCLGKETAEILEVAPKCAACPVQMELSKTYFDLGHTAFHFREMGEDLMGEQGEEFNGHIAEIFPEEVAELIGKITRRSLGNELESIDDDKRVIREDSEGLTRSCDGVLKLRGSRSGKEYTVAVCASDRAYTMGADAPTEQLANVWLRPKNR